MDTSFSLLDIHPAHYVRLSDAARQMRVPIQNLRRWVKKGQVPAVQTPTGLYYIPIAWVEAYLHPISPPHPKET